MATLAMHSTETEPRHLENPVLGISAVVRTTAEETDGALWRTEVVVVPGGNGGPAHIHLRQEERLHMLEGRVSYTLGGTSGTLRAGETLVVPPGTGHAFVNDSGEAARFLAEFRPALRIDAFFDVLFALGREGRTDARGLPHPLQAAVLMQEFADEFFYLPRIPVALQRAIAAPLAAIGRWRGYRATVT